MGGHQGEADERIFRGACRRNHGVDEYALVKGPFGDDEGFLHVAHVQRDNRAFRVSNLEAGLFEAAEGIVGDIPQVGDALGFLLDNVQGLQGAGRCGGRIRSLENVGTGGVTQVVDNDAVCGDETTNGRQALGEGTHDKVDLLGEVEVVAHAAALLAKDTQAVGFVHHDGYVVVLVLELHNLRQFGQVSFHGEHTVHHNELHGILGAAFEAALQVFHVVVLVVEALGKGQAAAVHDGGMVAVIANDEIVLGEELGDNAAVDGEAGGEDQGLIFAHEGGEFFFQLHVNVQRAIQETGAGATGTVFFQGFDAGVDDAFVTGEAGIGVGTEHEDLLTVHGNFGALFAGDLAEIRVNSSFLHLLRKVILGQSRV